MAASRSRRQAAARTCVPCNGFAAVRSDGPPPAKLFTASLCLDPSPHPAACTGELPLTCSDRTYRDEITTVELLVESTPIISRARSLVPIRIPPTDKQTRTLLISCDAQWQPSFATGCFLVGSPKTFAYFNTLSQSKGKDLLTPMATSGNLYPVLVMGDNWLLMVISR